MKNTLFILFFFSTNISIAQSYHPFPTSNASWSECTSYYTSLMSYETYTDNGFRYVLGNDTVIQSVKYTLVNYQHTWNYSFQIYHNPGNHNSDTTITTSNSSILTPGQTFGAIREDSTKKVWFRLINNYYFFGNGSYLNGYFPVDTDILLYDFNLKSGDTVKELKLPMGFATPIVVTSIDSIQLNDNTYRKVLWLSYGGVGGAKEFWAEGMGSSGGLFGAYDFNTVFNPEVGIWFNCFFQNGQNLYNNIIEPTFLTGCDSIFSIPDGVNTLSFNSNISVYPNPAYNELFINGNQLSGGEIEVSDLLGHVVVTSTVYSSYNKTSLDVKNLANGIYFLTIKDKYGNGTVTKFIKD